MSKRQGSGFSSLLLIVGLLAVVVVLAGIFPFRQIIAGSREVDAAEGRLAAIREETEVLESRISALQTPEEVERLAREQFGLVMPGEIGYVVVTPPWEDDGPAAGAQAETDGSTDPADRPWWRPIWDFLTGRDLAGDG
ncbi:MAG: septum formation initiator family protein [Acidimicrobiia bacterium]|nr:septum formation initiator family protein [Acidimicrobiia bacterium]